ncbi:MAG: hypothetical protein EB015_21485, partial [Methylocystaceae bacterium]|nr:hypothetical protein [Methylocystaceae bacterium]
NALLATGTMGGSLAIPPIFNTARNAYNLYRSANKADQYFRPNTSRPNSMQPEEMLRTDQIPTVRPKELKYDANYRDPAYFGTRTEQDPRLVAGDEGFGAGAANLGRNQNMSRQAEQEFIRDQLARMEGEGNVSPLNELLRRQINEEADRNFAQNQLSALEGEGGVTAEAIQAAKDLHNRRIAEEQARRDMEVARWEDEGGGMAHTSVPPVFTRDFVMGETIPMTHGILQGKPYYGPLATRSSTDMVSTAPPSVGGFTPRQSTVPQFNLRQDIPYRPNKNSINDINFAGPSFSTLKEMPEYVRVAGEIRDQLLNSGLEPEHLTPNNNSSSTQVPQQQRRELPPDAPDGFVLTPEAETKRVNPVIQQAMEAIRQVSAQRQEAPKAQERTTINWGDPDRASDFFRASKQMQEA